MRQNYTTAVSADGRFLSVGAFTAEMKIWEVKFSREGAYLGVEMVMGLKGHSSQVKCVGFSSDSRRAVTASLDGTLGVWNIDVRYHLREDAKRIVKVLTLAHHPRCDGMRKPPITTCPYNYTGSQHACERASRS